MIKRNRRLINVLGLSLFFGLGGLITLDYNIEFTGSIFLITSIGVLGYLLLFWLLKRKKGLQSMQSWMQKEVWWASLLVGLLCLIGAIETSSDYPEFTLVFILLLVVVLIFGYYKFRKNGTNFPYWLPMIGMGLTIIIFNDDFGKEPLVTLSIFYFLLLFFLLIRWFFMQIRSIIKLKNEQTKTELLHLQSQVNPHFFFNMLNNLYGLVEKDAKKAQGLILKLSDMMRYSIYDGQKAEVTLAEEVEYLKNYIELHKMRYHKKIEVTFNSNIQKECKIMPLLFIILLENAFKHGVEKLRANAYVHVNLVIKDNEIHFEIENNFDTTEPIEQAGIGLKNLKRRLELVYPKKHSLSFSIIKEVYKVELILKQL